MPRGPKPAKTVARARQAARRNTPTKTPRVRDLAKRLAAALEQQAATAEILNVIRRSPADLQPVLETVAESAARLCEAQDASIFRREGDRLVLVARRGPIPFAPVGEGSVPVVRGTVTGRSVLDAHTIQVADLQAEAADYPEGCAMARRYGHRTTLSAPLLREGVAIGAISLVRAEVKPFTEQRIALLQTFADQAVIAIENVRLFQELQEKNRALTDAHARMTEALDQKTATAEILRVIAGSPTDERPVFQAIVGSALRLLDGHTAGLRTLHGDDLHISAFTSTTASGDSALAQGPVAVVPVSSSSHFTRVVRDRTPSVIEDIEDDSELPPPGARSVARARGYRSVLTVPLLRGDTVLGVINVTRRAPGPFSADDIALLQTFADQAAIAIANVRLFKELQERTSELTRTVQQLTALGEVGRTLSSTLDLDTVLQTIVTRASQLAGTDACTVFEYDGAARVFRLRASTYADPGETETLDPIGRATPIPRGQGVVSRAAALRQPVQIPDIAVEGAYESPLRAPLLKAGYRAILTVPLLLEDEVIGALGVTRKTPGEFAPEIVRLLSTFATQSALAIQNARLFHEIADKSRQLEVASQHKSEFLANMSHELRTPLNAIIGFSEVLAERMFGEVNDKQAEYLQDILSSGRHLLSLINDILDLSKVEAGRLELELGRFHLPSALDNALTLVRERATRHGITLTQTVDEGVGEIVADERKVKQILLNLLSNAVKFTPEGGRVGLTATAAEGVITIAVSDTGIGIATEDQAAIFEEFRQVGRSDARKQEGTGLGLTLAKKFVELHGGQIGVESRVGQGSTFTFTLPVGGLARVAPAR